MSIKWLPVVMLACAAPASAGEKMPWVKDYAAATAATAATGKLIMIDFTGDH